MIFNVNVLGAFTCRSGDDSCSPTDSDLFPYQLSKKRAAELMLDELKKLPALPAAPSVAKLKRKPNTTKKKSRNLIKVTPEVGLRLGFQTRGGSGGDLPTERWWAWWLVCRCGGGGRWLGFHVESAVSVLPLVRWKFIGWGPCWHRLITSRRSFGGFGGYPVSEAYVISLIK